jgi:hypothetical protein
MRPQPAHADAKIRTVAERRLRSSAAAPNRVK